MHMAWMRQIGGRLESRYQYSGSMVYNNFPWPQQVTAKQRHGGGSGGAGGAGRTGAVSDLDAGRFV